MQSVFEEFLAWLSQTAQTLLEGVPVVVSDVTSQSATAFYQLKIIAGTEVPRFVQSVSPAEALTAAGLLMVIFGIRRRLEVEGLFSYSIGITCLVLGLGNIVNAGAFPVFLRI